LSHEPNNIEQKSKLSMEEFLIETKKESSSEDSDYKAEPPELAPSSHDTPSALASTTTSKTLKEEETDNSESPEVEDSKTEFLNNIKNPQQHYDSVKMKYFATLGMSKPPGPDKDTRRERTFTAPPQPFSSSNPARRRSVSGPVTNLERENGIPIPKNAYRHTREPSEDEPFFPMDSPSHSPSTSSPESTTEHIPTRRFIPPHEMVKKNKDFQVGTARSVAVYETRRRQQMNIS